MISYLYIIPAALISIILHELGHAIVSVWFGDPTPKEDGRLTLNPLKHLDPLGLLCLIIFHVGWAKPVQINPYYYKNKKVGTAIVSLAGPVVNILLALLSGLLEVVFYNFTNSTICSIIAEFFYYSTVINIGLGLFNLIPIPPLDGSKILGIIIPDSAYEKYMSYQKYSTIFMIIFIAILNILEYFNLPNILTDGISTIYSLIINLWLKVFGIM